MPRRQTFLQQVRGRSPVLLVDGGDAFFGMPTKRAPSANTRRVADSYGRAVLQAYNYMGYQAMAVGPSDIQFGVDELKSFLADAAFPVVCANLVEKKSGKPVFRESVVVEVAGVRFGIYGVLMDSLNPTYAKRVLGEDYEIVDPIATTKRLVPELRERCDVVVALSHLNRPENIRIADEVEGIDVIVDPYAQFGNKAIWVTEGDYLLARNGTPIVRIDGQGSRVGVFEMEIGENRSLGAYTAYDYPLEPQIYDHPELDELVEEVRTGRRRTIPLPAEPSSVRLLNARFLGAEACGSCHQEQLAFWRSTKHSQAYASLEGEQRSRHECVECHTVAYGVAYVDPAKVSDFKDVQCESCHGADPQHAENPRAHRLGAVEESRCHGCHNEAFTGKVFDYDAALEKASCPTMTRS